jgi:hypothetical protein
MTAPTITRSPTEAEIRAEIGAAMGGEEYRDVIDGIHLVASIVRDPAWGILEGEDPRMPDGPGLWADLRPSEAQRLLDLVNDAERRIGARVVEVIEEELMAACTAFAAEFPDAPRGKGRLAAVA